MGDVFRYWIFNGDSTIQDSRERPGMDCNNCRSVSLPGAASNNSSPVPCFDHFSLVQHQDAIGEWRPPTVV